MIFHGLQRVLQDGSDPRIARNRWLILIGHQLRLHCHPDELIERLDHILDSRHVALRQRHQSGRRNFHLLARGRAPMRMADQRSGPQIQHPFVLDQFAVADVASLVINEQAHDFPVSDIDDGLTLFRIPVPSFRIWKRAGLVKPVQVGAG